MIIKPPTGLNEFKDVRKTILELMNNPRIDAQIYKSLNEKLDKVNIIINDLK